MSGHFIHPTSVVDPDTEIGEGTQIWLFCHVRAHRIGNRCVLGKGVYVDADVVIGDSVKIQNNVSIYSGVTVEDGVFIGPHVCFTNDRMPRAVNVDMSPKTPLDWELDRTVVKRGASIGANATIRCGVRIGAWAMVGAGSVVTRDVPDHALVVGNPARIIGWVCECGKRIAETEIGGCHHE